MKYVVAIACLAAVAVPHMDPEPYARSCFEQSIGREGSALCKTAMTLWIMRDGRQHVMVELFKSA